MDPFFLVFGNYALNGLFRLQLLVYNSFYVVGSELKTYTEDIFQPSDLIQYGIYPGSKFTLAPNAMKDRVLLC